MAQSKRLLLEANELAVVDELVSGLPVENGLEACAAAATELTHQLPPRVLGALDEFSSGQASLLHLARAVPRAEPALATPEHWRDSPAVIPDWDLPLLLVAAYLGESFTWGSQQGGRLVTDVIPIRGFAQEQTGHGSAVEFDLHSEDAFTDFRCDCVMLTALRNRGAVPTLASTVSSLRLTPTDLALLAEPRFAIAIDTEHLRNADPANRPPGSEWPPVVPLVPLITGEDDDLKLRIDCAEYVAAGSDDHAAAQALANLTAELSRQVMRVTLGVGDLLLIDNHRAAHGRPAYQAEYDGTDRWLRRVMVAYPQSASAQAVSSTGQRVVSLF